MLKVTKGMGYYMVIRSLPSKSFCVVLVNCVRLEERNACKKGTSAREAKGTLADKHHGFEERPLYNCQKFVQLDAISLIQGKQIRLTSTRSKQTLCPIQNQDVKICFNKRHEKKSVYLTIPDYGDVYQGQIP